MGVGKIHLRMPGTTTVLCGQAYLGDQSKRSTINIDRLTCRHCENYIEKNIQWWRNKWRQYYKSKEGLT